MLDGLTQIPFLVVALVAGQDHTVERGAVYLLPLELPGGQPGDNKLCVDETHGGTITLADIPGFFR